MFGLLIADITSIQWRGFVNGVASLPFIINAFVASDISSAISLANWRWGVRRYHSISLLVLTLLYSMVCSPSSFPLVSRLFSPCSSGRTGRHRSLDVRIFAMSPSTRADPFPDLSFASSDIAQRRQQGSDEPRKPFFRAALEYLDKMDAFGLLLLTFGWCLMLLPFTLSAGAKGGYDNRKLLPIFEDPSLQTVLC